MLDLDLAPLRFRDYVFSPKDLSNYFLIVTILIFENHDCRCTFSFNDFCCELFSSLSFTLLKRPLIMIGFI